MKKILFFIVLLLSLNIVNAGKTIPLDFNLRDSYVVPMYISDRVAFNLNNGDHTIILDKINVKTIELDVFLFLDTKHAPFYTFIDKEHNSQIDFERDGEKDLLVKLISFDEKKAIIEFRNLSIKEEENKFEFLFNFVFWIIGIIVLITILILIYFKFRNTRINKENAGTGI